MLLGQFLGLLALAGTSVAWNNKPACCDAKCYKALEYADSHGQGNAKKDCKSYQKVTVTPCPKTITTTFTSCAVTATVTKGAINQPRAFESEFADFMKRNNKPSCPSESGGCDRPRYAKKACSPSEYAKACSCLLGYPGTTTTLKPSTITKTSTRCSTVTLTQTPTTTSSTTTSSTTTTISTTTTTSSSTTTTPSTTTTSSTTTTTTTTSSTTTTTSSTTTTSETTTATSATANPTSGCQQVTFTVSGSADVRNISASLQLNDAILDTQFDLITVSGTVQLAGLFCGPTVVNPNNQKLQLLRSNLFNNRAYWNSQGDDELGFAPIGGDDYSWLIYALNQGYPVLLLDHLGTGASSHPNPVLVQGGFEYSILHDLVTQIKAGTTGELPRSYNNLIFIGNGYGSVIGNNMAAQYPQDFSTMVLTGFAINPQDSITGFNLLQPAPAAIVDPARFGTLPPAYLLVSSSNANTNTFFGSTAQVDFDSAISNAFYQRRDVATLGQILSFYLDSTTATLYSGRVLVLTGEADQLVCGPGSPVIGPASCGNKLSSTNALFPVSSYSWAGVGRTGSATTLHTSAQRAIILAHNFLAGATYSESPV